MSDCATPTAYGPCAPYATVEDVVACGGCSKLNLEPLDPETNPDVALLQQALEWASRRVFEATGGQWWGCCSITVAPCRPSECAYPAGLPAGFPPPPLGGVPVQPWEHLPAVPWGTWNASGDPVFVNLWRCGCPSSGGCDCGAIGDVLVLPFGPVREVVSVTIDGDDLPAEDHWVLLPDGVLVRTDGETWPRCQDRTKPLGSDGTWSVTYRHGLDLPPEAVPLVARYACELARGCRTGECDLPPGFRVVDREGVEFGVEEPAEYRMQGLTGFGPVDDWITLQRGGHVGLADAPRAYRPRLTEELL